MRQNPPTGHFSRRVWERYKTKLLVLYFTYFKYKYVKYSTNNLTNIWPNNLARCSVMTDSHKFWVTCSSHWRNRLCEILSSVKGFGFCDGSNFDHSLRIEISPLIQGWTTVRPVILKQNWQLSVVWVSVFTEKLQHHFFLIFR